MKVRELMQVAPVIPVLVIDDVSKARPLAQALVAGGLRTLEVTLRTPQALDAMQAMSDVEGAIVGVGTALNAEDLKRAQDHGATFAVSPGFTQALGKAANDINMPLLPGIMTPADIMRARDEGFTALKFFPASQAGGPSLLSGFAGPFIDTVFCPTGGINANNARDYLSLPSVLCVGGSWVAPKSMVDAEDWEGITRLAAECQGLRD
ncbi:MAG: bifunctional 4-hydroxy-2-oxoglutarate aldolase/2-dehydro-3-deoxy-phosphogluconate aldolase [Granulosicoccus sp.]